jgi:hypothetical protein
LEYKVRIEEALEAHEAALHELANPVPDLKLV